MALLVIRHCLHFCPKLCKPPIQSRFIHKIIQHRKYQTSSVVYVKLFVNNENNFAHNVMENDQKYSVLRGEQNIKNNVENVEIDLNQNWRKLTADDKLENLRAIGVYCNKHGILISDERFDSFVDAYTEHCFDFTDDQLIKSLQILSSYPETKNVDSRNFVELWNALDDACVERIKQWDIKKILYICDHWYMLNLGKVNKFNWKSNIKIGRIIRKLPVNQLVQIMFYCNLMRNPVVEMFDFEMNMTKAIDDMSLNEIAIMSMGFFKTQTNIKNVDLVNNIYRRLINEIETVEDIPLVAILKILRYSSKFVHVELLLQLFDGVCDRIPHLSLQSCLHLALMGTNTQICHQKCIERIVYRFVKETKSARLKEFERITFVMGLFDFETESRIEDELCQNILVDLKNRVKEITNHPKCLPLCLHYLTMKGFHDEELIRVVLDKSFLKFAYGNTMNNSREIFSLNGYAKINLKASYKGNLLEDKTLRSMGKVLSQYIPTRSGEFKLSATDELLLEFKELFEKMYKHCYLAHALPHFDRPDLIIAYNKSTHNGVDIAHNFPEYYTGKILDRSTLIEGLKINTTDVEIINVIVGGWNNHTRNTNKLNGLIKLKMEQSEIIGFRPLLIPWFDWTKLGHNERKLYVNRRISELFQQK